MPDLFRYVLNGGARLEEVVVLNKSVEREEVTPPGNGLVRAYPCGNLPYDVSEKCRKT